MPETSGHAYAQRAVHRIDEWSVVAFWTTRDSLWDMISRLGELISAGFRRTAPDPFIIAILLTVVTVVLALTVATPRVQFHDIIGYWSGNDPTGNAGMWNLLAFGMQMCLILVTGHALASSPPVSRILSMLARLPRNGAHAAALVAFLAAALGALNWGLGLIAGAMLAREVGQVMNARSIRVHYPLIAAAGYMGLVIRHGGFSGSAPLKVTTSAEIIDIFGADPPIEPISLTETILSPMNAFVTLGLLVLIPLLFLFLSPKDDQRIEPITSFVDSVGKDESPKERTAKPFVPRLLEDSPIVTVILVAMIGWWAIDYYFPHFYAHSFSRWFGQDVGATDATRPSGMTALTPNTVNLTMLMLGLLLHGTPARYVRAIDDAARSCAGIILQFPLYAGIMAIMKYSGLMQIMAERIASSTNQTTLPLLTFVSAAVVNVFVPSGGGQWAVQGEIAMTAAVANDVTPGKMVMAVAYGDQLTNMLQPFWALPLLAITGVKARDIVGYTCLVMIIAGAWMTLGLLIF